MGAESSTLHYYKLGTFAFEQVTTALIPCVLYGSKQVSGQSLTRYPCNSNDKVVTLV